MKKNFLAIASLLIAAMLLMVSCNQEVAPKNNLVEAKLNVAYGRDLSVKGETDQNNLTLKYTLVPAWKQVGEEKIYGGTAYSYDTDGTIIIGNAENLAKNGSVGYVTPGLWNIAVYAYGKNSTAADAKEVMIFSGTASAYFGDVTTAQVFLSPVSEKNNTVTFNFKMQDLAAGMSGYSVKYSIYSGSNMTDSIKTETELKRSASTTEANVSVYTLKENDSVSLSGGFYRVNVTIYKGNDIIGGTTKGFLVSNGANVEIGGNIEPSDYKDVSIDAYYVKVVASLNAGNVGTKVTEEETGKVKVPVTFTVDTANTKTNGKEAYTVSYIWTSVSDGNRTTSNVITGDSGKEYTFEYATPGYKNVSCTVIYSIKGTPTGETLENTYYFADTANAQIQITPDMFK